MRSGTELSQFLRVFLPTLSDSVWLRSPPYIYMHSNHTQNSLLIQTSEMLTLIEDKICMCILLDNGEVFGL